MSNYWDIKCQTCNAYMGLNLNHGGDTVNEILSVAAGIEASVFRSFQALYEAVCDDTTIRCRGSESGRFDLVWLTSHAGHDLRASDEYGHVDPPPLRMGT